MDKGSQGSDNRCVCFQTVPIIIFFLYGLIRASNPVLPGFYADPEIANFHFKFYLYPTTDGTTNWMGTVFKSFSSYDLVTWKAEDTLLDLGPNVAWAENRAWAPCIASANERYYHYFCAETQIGVAVSPRPAGRFKDTLNKPLIGNSFQCSCQRIDPDVFIDDDNKAYLYFGQGRLFVSRLNADLISLATDPVDITPPAAYYNEGANVFKRNNTYYLLWSDNDTRDSNYCVYYGTAAAPTGPFTMRGTTPILARNSSLRILGTGHNSVVKVPGRDEWYICYHRFSLPYTDGYHRETCIDRMEFNTDGTIRPVIVTTAGPLPVVITRFEAEEMVLAGGVKDTAASASEGKLVKGGATGSSTLGFSYPGPSGTKSVTIWYYDLSGGNAPYRLYVQGTLRDSWTADNNIGGAIGAATRRSRVISTALAINRDDSIRIEGTANGSEAVVVDVMEIVPGTGTRGTRLDNPQLLGGSTIRYMYQGSGRPVTVPPGTVRATVYSLSGSMVARAVPDGRRKVVFPGLSRGLYVFRYTIRNF